MRHYVFWAITFVAGILMLSGCACTCGDKTEQLSGEMIDGIRVIKVTAKKFKYDPSVITVNQGDKVRLELTSLDVTHGFAIGEYGIDKRIEPGQTTIAEFTADKSGAFDYKCSVFCGMGHFGMKGTFIVKSK